MARPKSKDKRDALMAAATRVIAAQGLSAPTAVIAREAGISNGSLFTYFETKADLFDQLYLELKAGMATASLEGLPAEAPLREQFSRMWSNWMRWATSNPDRRRALALLDVSDDIALQTLRDVPMGFVAAMANSLAEATMDFMVNDPAHADEHCRVGFDALCRMLGSLFF
jgi:AcrR family transcriptional regulator